MALSLNLFMIKGAAFYMFKTPCCIGIDIGNRSLKAVVLVSKKAQFEVLFYSERILSTPLVNEQHLVSGDDFLTFLKDLKKAIPKSAKYVSLALPNQAVISKILPAHLNQSTEDILFGFSQSLLGSGGHQDELYIDYYPTDRDKTADFEGSQPCQVVACRKQTVDSRILPLKTLGFEPTVMELKTHALLWLLQHHNDMGCVHETWGIVDVGVRQTEFCVLPQSGDPFSRDLPFGLQQSEAIIAHTNGELWAPTEQDCLAFTQKLTDQLKRQLPLYQSAYPSSPLQGLWLAGGGENLISEGVLSAALGLEVRWIPPFSYCLIDKKVDEASLSQSLSQYAVAMGLALRGLET